MLSLLLSCFVNSSVSIAAAQRMPPVRKLSLVTDFNFDRSENFGVVAGMQESLPQPSSCSKSQAAMLSLEEIKDNLRSDKISLRKKARTECETRLFGDRLALVGNSVLTMGFLIAVVEYEVTEINLAQSKGKTVDLDVSVFFRNVARFCISNGMLKSQAASFLFEHSIDILCNEDLGVQFINNHKSALVHILQPGVVHGLSFDKSLKAIIIYLKEIMVDTAGLKDAHNHKLLKAAAMCMFRDDSSPPAFLSSVVSWLVSLLQQTSEEPQIHALVTATAADCCAYFLQFQSVGMYSSVAKDLEVLFQAVVKYLSAFQYREQHKDAYFHYIRNFLSVCTEYHDSVCTPLLASSPALTSTLAQLCEYLLSDTHLRSLVVSMRSQPSTGSVTSRDPGTVLLPELLAETNNKWLPVYSVMAKLVESCGLGGVGLEAAEGAESDAHAYPAPVGSKTQRRDAHTPHGGSDTQPSKRARVGHGAAAVGSSSTATGANDGDARWAGSRALSEWNLMQRIASISLDTSGNAPSAGGTAGIIHARAAATPGVSSSSAATSRQSTAHVLECTLVLVLVLLRSDPQGHFLAPRDGRGANTARDARKGGALLRWVALVQCKLEEALHHSSDPQLHGVVLLLLRELATLSGRMLNGSGSGSRVVTAAVEPLRAQWATVLSTVVHTSKLSSLFAANTMVRKDSLPACALQVVETIIRCNLLETSVLMEAQPFLWKCVFLRSPGEVECAESFQYMASLAAAFRGEVPSEVFTDTVSVAVALCGEEVSEAVAAVSDGRSSPLLAAQDLTAARSASPDTSGGQLYGVLCVTAWLSAQLAAPQSTSLGGDGASNAPSTAVAASASSLTRIPVSMLTEYAAAIHRMLGSAPSGDASPEADVFLPGCVVANAKITPLHWYDDVPRLSDHTCSTRSAEEREVATATDPLPALTATVKLLDAVKHQLVAAVSANALKNEASEQFNAWQTVTLLTLCAYGALSQRIHTCLLSTPDSASIQELLYSVLGSFVALVKALVLYTERKVPALKLTQVTEFFDTLSAAVQGIQPALQAACSPSSGFGTEAAQLVRLRVTCVNALLKTVRSINAIVLNKAGSFNRADSVRDVGAGCGRRHDADDEFMEHTTQSTINRANLEDDDLGDMDAPLHPKKKNVLSYSHDQLQAFLAVAKCAVAMQECAVSDGAAGAIGTGAGAAAVGMAGTLTTEGDSMSRVVDALLTTETLGQTIKLTTDCETKLLLAQALVPFSPSGAASVTILNRCAWLAEWGALGCIKVLTTLLQLLQAPAFWKTVDGVVDPLADSILGQIANYIFPEDNEALDRCLSCSWHCRFLQLSCIGALIQHGDVTAVKNGISTIFLSAFADTSVTVRMAAARLLPNLLGLFKNLSNVYQSLLDGVGIPLLSAAAGVSQSSGRKGAREEPLEVVALAEGIARMGGARSKNAAAGSCPLAPLALLDLFKLCCSRQRATSAASTTAVDFSALLRRHVGLLAHSLGYTAVHQLAGDHLRWLVHEWLCLGGVDAAALSGPSASQTVGSQAKTAAGLSLADFPCGLFSASTIKTVRSYEADASGEGRDGQLLRDFLRVHSSVIVPVICQLESSRYRWACILQYAAAAGYNGTDRDVAVIVKRNVCALKALELTLSCAADLRERSGLDFDYDPDPSSPYASCVGKAQFLSKSIQDFVTRSSNAAELSAYLTSKVTDTVREVVLLQVADSLDDCESSGECDLRGVTALLTAVLLQVSHLTGAASLAELFSQCNLLDVLSALHIELLGSKRPRSNIAVLAFLTVVVTNLPMPVTKVVLSAIFQVVHCSCAQFPRELASAIEVLGLRVHLIERAVKPSDDGTGTHRSPTKRALDLTADDTSVAATTSRAFTAPEVADFVPDLFAECVLLLKYCVTTLACADGNAAQAAVQVLQNSQKTDRHSAVCDAFVLSYFSTEGGSVSPASAVKQLSVEDVTMHKQAVITLNNMVSRLLHQCSRTFNTALLASVLLLPRTLHRGCFQHDCEPFGAVVAAFSLPERMKHLNAVIQRRLNGEMVALSSIWLQMEIILGMLLDSDEDKAVDAARGACAWNYDADLLSEFLSLLVGLCKHLSDGTVSETSAIAASSSHVSPTASGLQRALHSAVMRLLGHFGSPDLLSLNHNKFPSQPGNIVKQAQFKVDVIKQHLLLKVSGMLWGAAAQARVAAAALRELTSSGYFAIAPATGADLSTQRLLAEMYGEYCHAVIAREEALPVDGATRAVSSADIWSAGVWSTLEKASYQSWLCGLCDRLLQCCFTSAETASPSGDLTMASDPFLLALRPVCALRVDLCEVAFPLIIRAILEANKGAPLVVDALSQCVATHLLAPSCRFKRATQLGCNLLIFLLRQEVSATTSVPCSSPRSAQAVRAAWGLPFSYALKIDYSLVVAAATRSQLMCTALLFAELSDELPRHALTTRQTASVAPNRATVEGSGLHSALLPVYSGIHDADAIYGLDLCSTLELQALMYTHKGRWMEALTTYEGILQTSQRGSASQASADAGIAAALAGLGAKHTLQRYASAGLTMVSTGAGARSQGSAAGTLQQWNLPLSASTSAASSGASAGFFADIQDVSEAARRNEKHWQCSVTMALSDMDKRDHATALRRVQSDASAVFAQIVKHMSDETAVGVLPGFQHAQQLTEITEVGEVLLHGSKLGEAPTSRSASAGAQAVLTRWRKRLAQNSSSATAGDASFALRAALLRKLLAVGQISAFDAIHSLSQTDLSVRTASSAHAITPQAYSFWKEISQCGVLSGDVSPSQGFSNMLLQANVAYYECRLLWTKGLKDAAVSSVNTRVIAKLKSLLLEMNTAGRALAPKKTTLSAAANQQAAAEYEQDQETLARSRNLLSEALCSCGEWVSKKRAATGTEILDEYLDPAVQHATGTAETIRAYSTLATFHARLHQNLKAKIHSAEWAQGARVLADRRKEFDECRVLQEKLRKDANAGRSVETGEAVDPKTLYRHVATLKKEIELDMKEREAVEESVHRYLIAAVMDYAKVLELSKEADVDSVFRLVQLWLSNCDNAQVNALIEDIVSSVPSYKFVPLSYQILSRLGGTDAGASSDSGSSQKSLAERLKGDRGGKPGVGLTRTTTACSTFSGRDLTAEEGDCGFQLALCRMVLKLATEHPHHILPQLFALAHEREFSYDGAAHVKQNLSASRLETANMLVTQLKSNAAIQPLVAAMQTMLLAYIDLANASTVALQKVNRTKGIKFKEVQARGKRFNETMSTLPLAPAVITLSVPLSPRNDYSNVVTIEGFQQTFSITDNGISRPKIIICNGSDGRRYVQLVKGGDDMRQDAVMQQVFAIVNFTLAQDEETQKRNLAIRTYKIIPTTPQTGILEWVQNTAAFGSLLCDRESGVHGRYYPQDWTHGQCREHLKDAADNADKLRRYQDICESFHPAFRFFFLEKFPDPVAWVASRLAYSRSVATNSIIGYILGIGDRHAHNILIDTVTAEVVHIDFGIVFEQGKGLGTPETVPFRLTRDVVDGMGVTACEGTFRRSCEEVLRVLRDNASQIMTILEVVIHDPLYKWSLSPLQARMKQNTVPDFNTDLAAAKAGKQGLHNGHNGNAPHTLAATTVGTKGGNFGKDAAERTLLRVLNKLQGQEDPSSGETLSVEGQVDLLINEARSPHNLSKLFPGWAPWL